MAYNGSGTFLINTAGQPVVSGTVISSTAFNALTADLATGLSTAITKDGQTTVTANIPMSTYKFTGLGVGSAATDSANLSQVQSTVTKLLTSVSGTDTITAVGAPVLSAYAAGQMFYFVATGDNTGAVTLNIDSLGAKAVTRDGSVALAAGDIKSGEVVVVVYDGTRFQVVSQLNSAGDARFANVSIASSLYVGGVATIVGNAGFSANVSITSALSVGGAATITGATTVGGALTLSGGTANGVLYLNGSKAATSGSALTFDGTLLSTSTFRATSTTDSSLVSRLTNEDFQLYAANGVGTSNSGDVKATIGLYYDNNIANLNGGIQFTRGGAGTNGWMNFLTSGTERARIDASGNLGIGTSSPGVKLDVAGEIRSIVSGGTPAVYLNNGSTQHSIQNNSGAFTFYNSGVERMRLDTSGNLGIGTTSPGSRVTVNDPGTGLAFSNAASGNFNIGLLAGTGSALAYIYQRANSSLLFGTNNTEVARFDASGNLGIGTSSPAAKLQVVSGNIRLDNNQGLEWGGANNYIYGNETTDIVAIATNGSERARITSGGDLLVGTTNSSLTTDAGVKITPSATAPQIGIVGSDSANTSVTYRLYSTGAAAYRFYVGYGGTVYATNTTISSLSDQRLKENIQDLDVGLNKIMALKPRKFDWKTGKGKNIKGDRGFIAQEIEQVFPDLVDDWADPAPEGEEPYKSVRQDLIPVLVKAIQELTARVAQLESK